jgi:hypothetical protein
VDAEVSLTNQDLLPLFKKLITTATNIKVPAGAPAGIQTMLEQLNPKDLSDALEGLEGIDFVTYSIAGEPTGVVPEALKLYGNYADAAKLRRIISVKPDPSVTVQVYGGPGLSLFGYVVAKEGTRTRVVAGALRGRIDVDKLMGFVGRASEFAMKLALQRGMIPHGPPAPAQPGAPKPGGQ